MTTSLENMKAAVGVAICQGLDEVGATLLYSGARAINTGVGAKAGALMIGAGALSYYLQQTGCTWPEEGINTNQPPIPGCWGGTGGFVQVWQNQPFVEPGYQTSVTVNMQQFLGWITPFDFEQQPRRRPGLLLPSSSSGRISTNIDRNSTRLEPLQS